MGSSTCSPRSRKSLVARYLTAAFPFRRNFPCQSAQFSITFTTGPPTFTDSQQQDRSTGRSNRPHAFFLRFGLKEFDELLRSTSTVKTVLWRRRVHGHSLLWVRWSRSGLSIRSSMVNVAISQVSYYSTQAPVNTCFILTCSHNPVKETKR